MKGFRQPFLFENAMLVLRHSFRSSAYQWVVFLSHALSLSLTLNKNFHADDYDSIIEAAGTEYTKNGMAL